MAQNLRFDPVKRDYVVESGRPISSDRVLEAAYYALTIPRDAWAYGQPDQGSLLHTLRGQMHTPALEQQVANYSEDAINRQLVARGKSAAVAAGNIDQTAEASVNQVQVVPNEQQSNQINFSAV